MAVTWFSQKDYAVRLRWGWRGAWEAGNNGDILIVVDTLSFSTTVATATSRGVTLYPCRSEAEAGEISARTGAIQAVRRDSNPTGDDFTLSPLSFLDAPAGSAVALPSPNGSTCCTLGRDAARLFVGSLVNAAMVARAAAEVAEKTGRAITVLACGERWDEPLGNSEIFGEDGALRFALEDQLGAGAIIAALPAALNRSPEARGAAAVFRDAAYDLEAVLLGCGSGIELVEKGFAGDVRHSARLNLYDVAPTLRDGERLEA